MVARSTCGALGMLFSFPRDSFISQVARCVLGEMFTRKPILPGTSDLDQLEKIFSFAVHLISIIGHISIHYRGAKVSFGSPVIPGRSSRPTKG